MECGGRVREQEFGYYSMCNRALREGVGMFFRGTYSWWGWGAQKKVSVRGCNGSALYEALVPWRYGSRRARGGWVGVFWNLSGGLDVAYPSSCRTSLECCHSYSGPPEWGWCHGLGSHVIASSDLSHHTPPRTSFLQWGHEGERRTEQDRGGCGSQECFSIRN